MRIAMWSGPRNLSTAMMYSFGARSDCAIWDEPFYAPYLAMTGLDHPMKTAVLAEHETDPDKVADRCLGPIPDGKPHFYMKHMPHHMIEGMPLDWAKDCVNVHLIRHPARVLASYAVKRESVTHEDVGFAQQTAIHAALGGVIIDSDDIRTDPKTALTALCDAIGLPFQDAMLSWSAGGRAEDGVWAAHWYGAVHQSTGFAGPDGPLPDVATEHAGIYDACLPHYEKLHQMRLKF